MATNDAAYAKREFKRFLRAIGLEQADHEKVWAIIDHMQDTARKSGMSEDEMATTYDAETLIDIYRQSLSRRH
jgi:hypothetical protein